MIKSIKTILSQDKEKFVVPKKVQDLIPIKCIWPDGIFKVGNKFSKTYRFSDINYMVASREDKESMFLTLKIPSGQMHLMGIKSCTFFGTTNFSLS